MRKMFTMYRNSDAGNGGGGGGGGAPDFNSVMAALTPEQQAAITGRLNTVNEEAKGLRGRLKSIEDVHGKIKTKLNLTDITESDIEALAMNVKKAGQSDSEISTLKQQIQQLTSSYNNSRREQQEAKRNEAIVAALGKIGVRPDAIQNAMRLVAFSSNMNADGAWEFDGKPLDQFIESWKTQNQYMITNPARSGAGNSSAPNGGHSNGIDGFISEAEYMSMDDAQRRSPEIQKRARASMGQWGK